MNREKLSFLKLKGFQPQKIIFKTDLFYGQIFQLCQQRLIIVHFDVVSHLEFIVILPNQIRLYGSVKFTEVMKLSGN